MTSLTGRVISFARFLRGRGFKVFPSGVVESLRSLEAIEISAREDFLSALRANLAASGAEWHLFGKLFEEFWQGMDKREDEGSREGFLKDEDQKGDLLNENFPEIMQAPRAVWEEFSESEFMEGTGYSPLARLERKDFDRMNPDDIQAARLIVKNMISPFSLDLSRRWKTSRKAKNMDFRRILRKSLKVDGMPLDLFYRKKRKRLKRLVLLADVSGSMDRYARFVMPFILGLRGVGSRAEAFAFSTSLAPMTAVFRCLSIDKALDRISREVPDWSGGTRIGYSLKQFLDLHGQRLLNRRTVVLILSDGWDLGGRKLLVEGMKNLNHKAHCVIWLNPMVEESGSRPMCKGMQAALPYVDHFLPANSLHTLKKAGRTLARVMCGD